MIEDHFEGQEPYASPVNTGTLHYSHLSDAEALRQAEEQPAPLYSSDLLAHHVALEQINERLGRFFLDPFLLLLVERQKSSPPSQSG